MTAPSAPVGHNFGALNTARIRIAAPPTRVWELLFDRAEWLDGFIGKELVDGTVDAVGERARYRSQRRDGETGARLEEILLLEPERRLVQRLALPDDRLTLSFADWRLTPAQQGTLLEFTVYWLDTPSDAASWAAVQAVRADYLAQTQHVIDGHLERIKVAAERVA